MKTVQISVEELIINNPPIMFEENPRTVTQGTKLNILLSANDVDGDNLVYSSPNLPEGATLETGGLFTWTPNENQTGVTNVHFVVSDGELIDSQVVEITVKEAPTQNIHAPKIKEPQKISSVYNKEISVVLEASDEDCDTLIFSSINLPSGAILKKETGEFKWTPSREQRGSYSIGIMVSDGQLSDQTKLEIEVKEKESTDDRYKNRDGLDKAIEEIKKLAKYLKDRKEYGDKATKKETERQIRWMDMGIKILKKFR